MAMFAFVAFYFSSLVSTSLLIKSSACKFILMAFQPLYSVSERYEKAADVFRGEVVVPGTAQGGETIMKLEKSV